VKIWRDRTLEQYWWKCVSVQPSWKSVRSSLTTLKIALPCDPKVLGHPYPKELNEISMLKQ
jgi:hypothetical protein